MILNFVSSIVNQFKIYQPKIGVLYSRNILNQELQDDRIIWFPVRDDFTPTQNIGKNPLQVYSRDATIEFHMFSRDQNKLDDYINDMIIAIYEKCFEPQIVEMSGDYVDAGQVLQQGFGYILSVTLSGIIIRRPLRTAEIQTVEPQTHIKDSPTFIPPD